MSERTPPILTLWLLARCGSGPYAESLAGDLIEQYREGRSLSWLWRQVAMAVGMAMLRFIRRMPWMIVLRASLRLAAETAAVLAIAAIVDQSRRTPVIGEALNLGLMVTVAASITVASLAVLALIGTRSMVNRRQRPAEAMVGVLMLAFGVIALGSGTLTRADTTRSRADLHCSVADATRSGDDPACNGADPGRDGAGRHAECNCR